MEYYNELKTDADPHSVLSQVTQILTLAGFHLSSQNENELTFAGPGMRSTNQNPILGATQIRLTQIDHPLRGLVVEAELGGVMWMKKFMTRFPLILSLSLGCIFATVLLITHFVIGRAVPPWTWGIFVLVLLCNTVPWLFIAPVMTERIKKKTEQMIDSVINNADQIAVRASQTPPSSV